MPVYWGGLGSRNQISVVPRAILRTNSSDQDDENSVLLSLPLELRHYRGALKEPADGQTAEPPLVNVVTFDVGLTFESEKNFKNNNLVADGQFNFWFSTLGATNRSSALRSYSFDIRPYVGFEAGKHLASRVAKSHNGSLRRLKLGIANQVGLEFGKPYLDKVVLDVEYVYRFLLTEEARSRGVTMVLPAGTLIPVEGEPLAIDAGVVSRMSIATIDEGSRSYLNAAIRFTFTPNWEFFTAYVNGELPPLFARVNKFQAGFAFRANAPY